MKTFNLLWLSVMCALLSSSLVYSQEAPPVEWKINDIPPANPVSPIMIQDGGGLEHAPGVPLWDFGDQFPTKRSGEDWWYGITNHPNPSEGYITCGYATWMYYNIDESVTGVDGCVVQNAGPEPNNSPDLARPVKTTETLSSKLATMAHYNKKGEMTWCKAFLPAEEGAYSVVKVNSNNLLTTGWTVWSRDIHGDEILANPTAPGVGTDIADVLDGNGDRCKYHLENEPNKWPTKGYLLKVDELGNMEYVYTYSFYDLIDIDDIRLSSLLKDLVIADNGNTVLIGKQENAMTHETDLFIIEVDPDGIPVKKRIVGHIGHGFKMRSITKKSNGNYIVTGCLTNTEVGHGIAIEIDKNTLMPLSSGFGNTTLSCTINDGTTEFQQNVSLIYIEKISNTLTNFQRGWNNIIRDSKELSNGNIAFAVILDCKWGLYSHPSRGKGRLQIYTGNGQFISETLINSNAPDPNNVGMVSAFDLMMNFDHEGTDNSEITLITTVDEGNLDINDPAFINSMANISDGNSNTPSDFIGIRHYDYGDGNDIQYDVANTSAYLANYDINGNLNWEKIIDIDDNPLQEYPGDWKEQECVYQVVKDDDGAFVFVGNTSHNKDDYLLAKVYSTCQLEQTYQIAPTNPSIDNSYILPTGTTVWDVSAFGTNDINVRGEIIVPAGATLRIQDMTVRFADSRQMNQPTKFIVEAGGILILDHAVLTSSTCPRSVWSGIEVRGTSGEPQITNFQGKIISQNNTIIEKAHEAISTIGTDENGFIWGTTGAILSISETHFINNWRSIQFMSYENDHGSFGIKNNVSRISKSEFTWDANFPSYAFNTPQRHISMWDVKGVKLEGNTFTNNHPESNDHHTSLNAIYTMDAGYTVTEHCVNGGISNPGCVSSTPSTFNNFNVAVHSEAGVSYKPKYIKNANFINNHSGIRMSSAGYTDIRENYFSIKASSEFLEAPHGIRIDGSSSHKIYENTLEHSGGAGLENVGIYTRNGNYTGMPNTLYKNTMTDLNRGLEFSGDNSSIVFDCNEFHDNETYFSQFASMYKSNGLLEDQGDCSSDPNVKPVSNLHFSTSGSPYSNSSKAQFVNIGQVFDYNTYDNFLAMGIINTGQTWQNTGASPISCGFGVDYNPSNPDICPSIIPTIQTDPDGTYTTSLITDINNLDDVLENLQSGLLSASDEDDLITILQGSGNDHSKEQALLEKSPYLTDRVLKELVISNLANFRKNNVLQLHYPVSDDIMDAMVESPYPITPYILRDALVAGAPVKQSILLNFFSDETIPNWAINDVGVANSPLSDEELLSILNRSNTLEPYRLWNILSLNTELSEEVMGALLSLDPPTANWVLNKISTHTYQAPDPVTRVKSGRSPLDRLKKSIRYTEVKKYEIVNDLVKIYIDSNEVDSAIVLLENQGTVRASCALVPILAAKKQTKLNTHIQLIKDFVSSLGPDESELANELLRYCDYHEFIAPIIVRTGGYYSMSPDEIDQVRALAETNTMISSSCYAILDFLSEESGYHLIEPLQFDNGAGKKSTAQIVAEQEEVQEDEILVYPNPNNGNFIMEGALPSNQSEGKIVFTDVSGRIVKQYQISGNKFRSIISLDNARGIYIYNIVVNNASEYRGKIVVQ